MHTNAQILAVNFYGIFIKQTRPVLYGKSETRDRTADMMVRDNDWLFLSRQSFKHPLLYKYILGLHVMVVSS